MKRLRSRRLLNGNVVLLTRVVAQVVELEGAILIPLDQLPFSVADGTRGVPPWLP